MIPKKRKHHHRVKATTYDGAGKNDPIDLTREEEIDYTTMEGEAKAEADNAEAKAEASRMWNRQKELFTSRLCTPSVSKKRQTCQFGLMKSCSFRAKETKSRRTLASRESSPARTKAHPVKTKPRNTNTTYCYCATSLSPKHDSRRWGGTVLETSAIIVYPDA